MMRRHDNAVALAAFPPAVADIARKQQLFFDEKPYKAPCRATA
jgi:hypothetical protein